MHFSINSSYIHIIKLYAYNSSYMYIVLSLELHLHDSSYIHKTRLICIYIYIYLLIETDLALYQIHESSLFKTILTFLKSLYL